MNVNDTYLDPHLGISNSMKLRQDIKEGKINKLCMTEVVNADVSIAAYGEEVYYSGCKDVLDNVALGLKSAGLDQFIHLYSFNYKNFVLAADSNMSKDDFFAIIKQIYFQYESASSTSVEVSAVSRFAVVLQEDRLIERALHCHLVAKDTQENFVLSPDHFDMASVINEDAKVLDIINFAMEEHRVVPFYQGIRNNKTGKIDKYEALMRIVEEDGTIYSPALFLDVAKKYKIYNSLSLMMVEKALEEFRNRPEQLSINISAYDIGNEQFTTWFLETIKTYPNTHNLVIEFVETENYQDGKLFDFIRQVRKHGCKVSADDFGSGYATYSAIISLSPSYIKIDGTIIKDVATAKENVIILRSICFMAELVGAETIAEYVENEEIQAVLEEYGVNYSQGYLYSKPLPIDKLLD